MKNTNGSVTVILPNYNYEKYILSRLDEVLNQTYRVKEVIIIDDASEDGSSKLIKEKVVELKKEYKDIKFITVFNEKNSGSVFAQWKKGVELATSDYIWIAEMDDSSKKTFLKTVMKPVNSDEEVVLSYSNSRLIGKASIKDKVRTVLDVCRRRHLSNSYVIDGKKELEKNLAVYNSIPNVSACVIKNIPELKQYLNEAKKYKLSGDWYFYVKLAKYGKIAYSNKKLNLHRLSNSSVTSKTDFNTRFRELQQIHAEVLTSTNLSKETKKRIVVSEMKLAKNWGLK